MDDYFEYQSEILCDKVRHYLITTTGKVAAVADTMDIYRALVHALREEIMINWSAINQTVQQKKVKQLYYISMEYMPGKFLNNNITNINLQALVHRVLEKLGRNYQDILCFEAEPGLGMGGLGRLGSCFLDSLATHHYPTIAYGLRYQYGVFQQELWDGIQVERPDDWLLYTNSWEQRQDTCAYSVKFTGTLGEHKNSQGEIALDLKDFDEVRALAYDIPIIGYHQENRFGVVTLRLWSTKLSPRNFQLQRYNAGQIDQASENTTLTDVLYPGDQTDTGKRIRIKQEFLLVSASLKDILNRFVCCHGDFSHFIDKVQIQINDTHPALIVAELMRILIDKYNLSWGASWEITKNCINFTNHTVLSEAREEWNANRISILLPRQYRIIERINLDLCDAIRAKFPGDEERVRRMSIIEEGKVRWSPLCVYGSHKVNGVAKLHAKILRATTFKDFYEMFPEKFLEITNGVTPRRWLLLSNPQLASLIIRLIGSEWITDFEKIKKLADYASHLEIQNEFTLIKRRNKQRLIDVLTTHYKTHDKDGNLQPLQVDLNINSLFDVQIKRIHEYKRQILLLLFIIDQYLEIRANPNGNQLPRTIIFSGKAASNYEFAKQIIQAIFYVARTVNSDKAVDGKLKIIFIENYNVSHAELIIPAAELSEQLSTAGFEASGTGNMKLAMNGALTIGTEDGANIEMREAIGDTWWPFRFGATAEEIHKLQLGHYNPFEIYSTSPRLKRVLDTLTNRTFAQNDAEHQTLSQIYQKLLEERYGQFPDRYFVLHDFASYIAVQAQVEELYRQPNRWAEMALHNIAGMGKFSSDVAIHNYATEVWKLDSCPIDEQVLAKVREEYSEHDRCRIFMPDKPTKMAG